MELLNESVRLEDLPADDVLAFRGIPVRARLNAGTSLYRFATDGESAPLGKWWVSRETYQLLAMRAQRLGSEVQLLARSKLAVQHDWSSRMNRVYIGTLLSDVYGFHGPAKYQRLFGDDPKVLLPGNFEQVWVGNLSPAYIRLVACDL